MEEKESTLAVDIGGPIIDAPGGSRPDRYRVADPTKGSFAGLKRLGAERFGDRIRLISQCSEEIELVKRAWMARHRFHEASGIPVERIHFVRRPEEKAEVCARYGVTHFVDDRPHILAYAAATVPHLYLYRPRPEEAAAHPDVVRRATLVMDWDEILHALLADGPTGV